MASRDSRHYHCKAEALHFRLAPAGTHVSPAPVPQQMRRRESVLGSVPLLSFRVAAVQPSDNISRKHTFKVSGPSSPRLEWGLEALLLPSTERKRGQGRRLQQFGCGGTGEEAVAQDSVQAVARLTPGWPLVFAPRGL